MQILSVPSCEKHKLTINQLAKRVYQIANRQKFWPTIILLFAIFGQYSCSRSPLANEISQAEKLLWSAPDSCLTFLACVDYSQMSRHDSCVCALICEHASMKVYYGLEDDSLLHVLKDYFEEQDDHRYAGEACYIIGRNLFMQQHLPMATFYQKAAEEHLLKAEAVPDQLLGMVYYGLGSCAEYERLFIVANEYFQKARTYFLASGDSLYISCAYRDMAKTSPESEEQVLAELDTALHYLPRAAWSDYMLDIQTTIDFIHHKDPDSCFHIYRTLCDSLGNHQYAAELCKHFLNHHQPDSAIQYLEILGGDSTNSIWSKERYYFYRARYLYAIGNKDSAYCVLRDLHLWQTSEIEASSYARAYMVEQRYDAERERADKMQAEADKRRAHLIIIIGAITALLLISILLLLLQHERMRKRKKEEENRAFMERLSLEHEYRQQQLQLKNENLQKQLLLRQKHLQEQLRLKLSISSELKKQKSQGKAATGEAYQQLMSSVVFISPKQWNPLLHEFDIAYAGLITDLSGRYEQLTETDCLYIALIVLGCSNEDISELVNVSPQSVRNRKMLIKQHMDARTNIEQLLQAEAEKAQQKLLHT